jgi:hypothetical protein
MAERQQEAPAGSTEARQRKARRYTYTVSSGSKAGPSAVYALLVQSGSWPSWSPIDSVEIEGGGDPADRQQVGDIRVFRIGRVISRERITDLVPDQRFTYEIEGGPFRFYRGVVELEAAPEGGTDITWSASLEPKLPLSGPFWRWYLTRFLQRMADGLAAAAGSGGLRGIDRT